MRINSVTIKLRPGTWGMLSFFIVLFGGMIQAQQLKPDLEQAYAYYTSSERLAVELEVHVFSSANDEEPFLIQHYSMMRDGNSFTYDMDDTKMLVNDRCIITVSESEKRVFYTPKKKARKSEMPAFNVNLDSVIAACDSAIFVGMEGNTKKYRLFAHTKEVPVMEMYLSSDNNRIVKLCYYYNTDLYPENNMVEVIYRKWDIEPLFEEDTFSEKKYLVTQGNELKLNAAYRAYTLILNEPTE
jgi:hypothetical protein